jgi:estrogen-related receptor beta like 1
VLHGLCKEVIKRLKFEWGGPQFPEEALADEVDVEDDSVDEDEHLANEEEEEDLIYCEAQRQEEVSADEDGMLEAHVDPQEWALELERVVPKLRITLQMSEGKEWRNHLVQTRQYHDVICKIFPDTKTQLQKLGRSLNQALERIRTKEAFINSQFDDRALIYRNQQEELQSLQLSYNNLNETVINLQNELRFLTNELDSTKSQLEDMSSTVTDTTPIVKIKDAFQKLRKEARQLEVKIGVVSHTLMQAKLRHGRSGADEGLVLGGAAMAEEGD